MNTEYFGSAKGPESPSPPRFTGYISVAGLSLDSLVASGDRQPGGQTVMIRHNPTPSSRVQISGLQASLRRELLSFRGRKLAPPLIQ